MLSEQSAATVRATLPAVGASLGEITERFYAGMFAARPELLRDLFNRGNQAAGTQRQALAGSIAAFAAHLVDHPDDRPDAMLSRIAHKHASLGVAPDQYAIVHEHLFAAIAEVLGDAVTPGGRRLGGGLLADGERPDRRREAAPRGARRGRVAALGGRRAGARDRRRGDLPAASGRRRPGARLPPGPVRLRAGPARGRRPADTAVQPLRGARPRPAAVQRQAGARGPGARG